MQVKSKLRAMEREGEKSREGADRGRWERRREHHGALKLQKMSAPA